MQTRFNLRSMGLAIIAILTFAWPGTSPKALAQDTLFTYQGRLDVEGAPHTGNAEFRPTLWDAPHDGSKVADNAPPTLVISVTNGLFTLPLDFGASFPGAGRWLQLEVRTVLGPFTLLSPRQPLTPTPYAITAGSLAGALPAAKLGGPVPSANLAGTYSGVLTFDNPANQFTGSGAGLTALNASQLTSGTVPDARLAASVARTNQVWLLGGNAGTTPGTHFIGTRDNQPLELRVHNQCGLRLEPNAANAPNVIGGFAGNYVSNTVVGATIAGGGAGNFGGHAYTNRVLADFGTVSGGANNTASGADATVGGGGGNTAHGVKAVVAGGGGNFASGFSATVAGGSGNTASGQYATVAGGWNNTASGNFATVGGGSGNIASGYRATVGGGEENTARDFHSTVGGGSGNTASGQYATVAGGFFNTANTNYATVGGGRGNRASGFAATIPGGADNSATVHAFAAGRRAKADHTGSFVWADSTDADFASTAPNQFLIRAAGGVGIGTPSPAEILDVAGGNALIRGPRNFVSGSDARLSLGDTNYYLRAVWDQGLRFSVRQGEDTLRIQNGGRVGVGRTPTANALEVEGNASKTAAGSWLANSDARIKQDIATVTNAIETLSRVRLVSFRYTDAYRTAHPGIEDRRYLNVVAQEFAEVFPDHVQPSGEKLPDGSDILQVDAHPLTIYTAAAVQELSRRLDEERAANAALRDRLARLEQLVGQLIQ